MAQAAALLLDLDNTLIDRDAAFLAFIESLRPHAALDTDALIAIDRGGYGDKRALFSALGVALGVSSARARAKYIAELPAFVTLKEDAERILSAFAGPKVILTNGASRLQHAKIRAAGLESRVDAVLVSEEVGHEKPHPSIFRTALARAGVDARDALMIGDHPISDVEGALDVGARAVMVRTRWFEVPVGVPSVARLTEVTW